MSTTVITFGTFDVFHVGHVRILNRAAALGDRLVVGLPLHARVLDEAQVDLGVFHLGLERGQLLGLHERVGAVLSVVDAIGTEQVEIILEPD